MSARASGGPRGARAPRGESALLPHTRALVQSAAQMRANGAATAMSIAVMAIALALPAMLLALVQNQQALAERWGAEPTLTAFLHRETAEPVALDLAERLRIDARVGQVEFVDRDEAFAEFSTASGLAGIAAGGRNPLPHVLVVTPHSSAWAYDRGQALVDSLEAEPAVDSVLVDFAWVERLQAIGALAERVVFVLAGLLGAGALLIVANTVRVLVHQQRDEIEVLRLVGATNAFVRRPFLYGGALHGLLGGLVAAALVHAVFLALAAPFERVAQAYLGGFELAPPGLALSGGLIALSCALGWLGAFAGIALALRRLDARPPP